MRSPSKYVMYTLLSVPISCENRELIWYHHHYVTELGVSPILITFSMSRGCYDAFYQWFSKCGLQDSSISITWELAGNANSWPHPRHTQSEILEWASAICVLTIPPGNADAARVLKIIALWAQLLFLLPAGLCKVASILTSSLPDTESVQQYSSFHILQKNLILSSHLGALHRCHSVFPLCLG